VQEAVVSEEGRKRQCQRREAEARNENMKTRWVRMDEKVNSQGSRRSENPEPRMPPLKWLCRGEAMTTSHEIIPGRRVKNSNQESIYVSMLGQE